MKSFILDKLFTKKELQNKVKQFLIKYKKYQENKDYREMVSILYEIASIFDIMDNEEKIDYYQKIIDIWKIHPDEIPDYEIVATLEKLKKPEEAFQLILSHPECWGILRLAKSYEQLGRYQEAHIVYEGMAHFSYQLSEECSSFWRPHHLRNAADLYEKAHNVKLTKIYGQNAVAALETKKGNIEKSLELIEEAWLYEEVGYIYEKAKKFEMAMDYYESDKIKYESAYTEDPEAVIDHHIDGDWDKYFDFFSLQMPDLGLIYFYFDSLEENDFRRIKYRILNLKEQMKKRS
ncbi:MAG: hypothetical protein PVF58_10030 [Candidatus Methanofastidiosia archaeon]|jgi:tetratricopeptide (TPR) repeat protein